VIVFFFVDGAALIYSHVHIQGQTTTCLRYLVQFYIYFWYFVLEQRLRIN